MEIQNQTTFRYFPFFNKKQPVLALIIFGLIFYGNSLYNEYALDDGIIIHQNESVLKGIKGIPEILTEDTYYGFYNRMCAGDQLQGGRYRPLPVISFAIEQQFIHPYRTGFYLKAEDSNKNGMLDNEPTTYTNPCGKEERNYEYNESIDLNNDGLVQANECAACWDLNRNFHNDADEDLNKDGVFNEVDCQVYGSYVRHFNNIWTYILACVLLYLVFSRYMFRNHQDIAFIAALLFLIHPVHTEVVANVRGRDDIFSLLFISLTFLFSFKFIEERHWVSLLVAAVTLFLALLSKEYAALMFILLPLALYVFSDVKTALKPFIISSLAFLVITFIMIRTDSVFGEERMEALAVCAGVLLIFVFLVIGFRKTFMEKGFTSLMMVVYFTGLLYLMCRVYAVDMGPGVADTEILNNPFLFASGEQAFATKVYVLLKYLKLVIFPYPLVSDYSYATIAYRNATDPDFMVAFLLYFFFTVAGIWLSIKKHPMGFALLAYVLSLVAVNNFIFRSGVMMLEANLFHASTGAVMLFAWVMVKGVDKLEKISFPVKRVLFICSVLALLVVSGCIVLERNRDWKNDVTLFLKDVDKAPHSVLVMGNAGARWIDLADTREITGRSLPGQDTAVYNDYNGALKISDEEVRKGGYRDKREAALQKGIAYLEHAIELHPKYVNGYLNLGLAHYKLGNDMKAIYYWKNAGYLYPENPYLRNYYIVFGNQLKNRGTEALNAGDFEKARVEFNKRVIVDPYNSEGWYNLGGAYYNLKNREMAKKCWEKAVSIEPDYAEAKKSLSLLNFGMTDK